MLTQSTSVYAAYRKDAPTHIESGHPLFYMGWR